MPPSGLGPTQLNAEEFKDDDHKTPLSVVSLFMQWSTTTGRCQRFNDFGHGAFREEVNE